MAKEGGITREEISSIARSERRLSELQEIRKDFYTQSAAYLKDQKARVKVPLNPDDFTFSQRHQAISQTKSSTIEIQRFRLKKISTMAVMSVFGSDIEVDFLTPEEKQYYDSVKQITKKFSDDYKKMCGEIEYTSPDIQTQGQFSDSLVTAEDDSKGSKSKPEPTPFPEQQEMSPKVDASEDAIDAVPLSDAPLSDVVTIRVLEDLPPFAGIDRNYTLHKEEVAVLPRMFAEALIANQKAVQITPS